MGVEYERGEQPLEESAMIADRPLYLDKTESVIVEEGDPRSAFQFTGKGRVIEAADAKRLGLSVVDGRVVQGAGEVAAAPIAPATEESEAQSDAEADAPADDGS